MNQIEDLKPEALILGGISSNDFRYFQLGERLNYLAGPNPLQTSQEEVIARKRMSTYFEE
jgi:hypothetical protein